MNIAQITAFRAAMTSTSVSEAARKLGRTQPAVSLAIRALEQSLGMALFERRGRRLVPVPEAYYLLAETEEILDRLAVVERTMKALAQGQQGQLSVAVTPSVGAYLFPRFLSRTLAPEARITAALSLHGSKRIQELVSGQNIDFGFADAPHEPADSPHYRVELVRADGFLALNRAHPLAGQERISLRDLDGLPIGAMQPDHANTIRLRTAFEAGGARFNQKIESLTVMPLLQFVREGTCIGAVDPLTVASEREVDSCAGRIVFRPLEEPIRFDYAIYSPRHRPLSQLARAVKEAWLQEILTRLRRIGANPELG